MSEKLVRELRNRDYSAYPISANSDDNNWGIDKIIVTKSGKDICDINCKTGTISYINSFDRSWHKIIRSYNRCRRTVLQFQAAWYYAKYK